MHPGILTEGRYPIVFITVDCLRLDSFLARTRRPDRRPSAFAWLAGQGAMFSNHVAPYICTPPSMAAMFTGLYPRFAGVKTWGPYTYYGLSRFREQGEGPGLPQRVPTLATWLAEEDYTCWGFNTNPYLLKSFGFARGYVFYEDYREEDRTGASYYPPGTTVLRDAAGRVRFHPRERFCLWIHLMDAHLPWNPPPDLYSGQEDLETINQGMIDLYKHQEEIARLREECGRPDISLFDLAGRQQKALRTFVRRAKEVYEASVDYIDAELTRFLTALDEAGLLDETLFILCADHGEEFGEYGFVGHHGLAGATPVLLRTPLVMRMPRSWGLRPGPILGLSTGIDIVPTLLDLLGRESTQLLDGISLLPLIRGEAVERGAPFHVGLFHGTHTIWTEAYRYVRRPLKSQGALFHRQGIYSETEVSCPEAGLIESFEQMYEAFLASDRNARSNQEGLAGPEDTCRLDQEVERRLKGLGYL